MEILQKDTYLAMLRNAVGSKLFQTVFVSDEGKKKDVLNKGDLSCAFFVSSILHHFKLVDTPHATVNGMIADMEKNGWRKTDVPEKGAVLLWEEKEQKGEMHRHTGFYVGDDQAVSNNPEGDTPFLHHATFDDTRQIEAIYTHDFLQ